MAPLGTILAASAGAANIAARGFSYHLKSVRFIPVGGGVNDMNYTVTALSISSGQDPQTMNRVSDTHTMFYLSPSSDGSSDVNWNDWTGPTEPGFEFNVGRHKTDAVGNFWTSQIPAAKPTFNHDPGALNFAFLGSLDINLPLCQDLVHFTAIGLAQGSDSNGNNWWFGGQSCTYIGSNSVSCTGTRQNGKPVAVTFQRGGSGGVNDIFINDCQ